jgi:hypothetical protein
MPIVKNVKLNGTPQEIYGQIKELLARESKEMFDLVEWNDRARCGKIDKMGAKGDFNVTGNSELKINASIGFPASLKYSEEYVSQVLDRIITLYK